MNNLKLSFFLFLSLTSLKAAILSPCVEELLMEENYSPVTNEAQLSCLEKHAGLLKAETVLCTDKKQSIHDIYYTYKTHKEAYAKALADYKLALQKGENASLKKALKDNSLSLWQIQGFKLKVESALMSLKNPILGDCHISKF